MKNWQRTDEELLKSWWRTNEELMKNWQKTDKKLMKSWWGDDEELVKLAQELQRLSLAEEEYLNYFLWKAEFREENQVERLHANWMGCQLCKALNQRRPSKCTYNGYTSHALPLPRACDARLGRIVQELEEMEKVMAFVVFLFHDTFKYSKMSRNRRNDKIPWEIQILNGLCCFSRFLTFL